MDNFHFNEFIILFYGIIYFMMNPWHIYSLGIPAVYYTLASSPPEVFYCEFIYTAQVIYMYSMVDRSSAHILASSQPEVHFLLILIT